MLELWFRYYNETISLIEEHLVSFNTHFLNHLINQQILIENYLNSIFTDYNVKR